MISKRLENENEQEIKELLFLVSNLKQRVIHSNGLIRNSNIQIEVVGKKVNENRSFVNKMNIMLYNTIPSSTSSCKSYIFGLGIVFALWIFAYIVTRIFHKVKQTT